MTSNIIVASQTSSKEEALIAKLIKRIKFPNEEQESIIARAKRLINTIRNDYEFGIEEFMQQFSLSTEEGVAIMCEGLLRIPDKLITLEFVFDKLANKKWHNHLGRLKSFKGKLTTFGLYFSGAFAGVNIIPNVITKLITKIGEPLFLNLF